MTEKEKQQAGELYNGNDPELVKKLIDWAAQAEVEDEAFPTHFTEKYLILAGGETLFPLED